jgi:plasmid maintenance system killer protein
VKIGYSSKKLQKLCTVEKEMVRKLGRRVADELQERLAELEAAEVLDNIRCLPYARCHELTADRKGQLTVDIAHPKRLIFKPDHDPVPNKGDGGLDWRRVTSILILEIVDYH